MSNEWLLNGLPFRFQRLDENGVARPIEWTALEGSEDTYTAPGLRLDVRVERDEAQDATRVFYRLTNTGAEAVALSQPALLRLVPHAVEGADLLVRTYKGGRNLIGYLNDHWKEHTLAWTPGRSEIWRIGSDEDGRSSNHDFPFVFLLHRRDGMESGLVMGMEWSGTWEFNLTTRDLTLGIPVRAYRLAPGAAWDLPALHLVGWQGGFEVGHNALRRYVRDGVMPRHAALARRPPVSYSHWYGMGTDGATAATLLPQVKRAAELGVEIFEVDAGWQHFCGPQGNAFGVGTGNWRYDTKKFPDGLAAFSQRVRDHGMRFGLWIDLEKAFPRTEVLRAHADIFLSDPGDVFLHLDLRQTKAQHWLADTVSRLVETYQASYFRWDYNIAPQRFFNALDPRVTTAQQWDTPHEDGKVYVDRMEESVPSGEAQFAHYAGLYAALDEILRRHPDLIIEGCASGGRRMDFAFLRRSHLFWISDHSENAAVCRYTQLAANRLMPGGMANRCLPFGTGEGRHVQWQTHSYGPADLLGRMAGALQLSGDIAAIPAESCAFTRRMIETYKTVRHLLNEDFLALTPQPARLEEPEVAEFATPDSREALVYAFPGFLPGAAPMPIRWRGLIPAADYTVRDLLADKPLGVFQGARLMAEGLSWDAAAPAWLHAAANGKGKTMTPNPAGLLDGGKQNDSLLFTFSKQFSAKGVLPG